MKRIAAFVAASALAVACSPDQPSPVGLTAAPRTSAISAPSDPASGNYLVRFRGTGIPADFALRVNAVGGQIIFAHAGVGIAAVSGLDRTGADALAAAPSIAAVDADAYTTIDEPMTASESVEQSIPTQQANPAGAFLFARQWNMRAISAPAAWAAGNLGKSSVRVGIIDTGIDYLSADTYGKVDFTLSQSFLSAAQNARVEANFPGQNVKVFADLNGHGTHVAATVSSNAFWFAGVTSKATLVALKVCTPEGSCPTSSVLNAILYASDKGLDVVNMSLGGAFNRRDASARGGFGPSFLATINSVFNYAYRSGTTVVVAAGNAGIDMDHDGNAYNAYCNAPHVICVSATGPTGGTNANPINVDALAGYSNYGRSAITVAAPGGNALGVQMVCSGFSIVFTVCQSRTYNPATGSASTFVLNAAGTSMATPHVTGLAALVAGEVGRNPSTIAARISNSADQLGWGGNSPPYGAGRINVAHAMGVN
ncbi:MAG TPA: S8 family serine peptidase [Gemmatimonadaceae bacterium]|nr:S8 family serine peptidase [Gemmatimonadaceae bacterium]